MEYVANYANLFNTAGYGASAEMAWGEILSTHGEGPRLTSAKHDVVEGDSRRFRTKSGRASSRGPRGKGGIVVVVLVRNVPDYSAASLPSFSGEAQAGRFLEVACGVIIVGP